MDIDAIKRIATALEANLHVIADKKQKLDNVLQKHPNISLNDLYDIVKLAYAAESTDNFENYIPLSDYKDDLYFMFVRESVPFSSQAHTLMIESQSQLNVLCTELKLPVVYLSTKTATNDAMISTITDNPETTLSEARSVVLAAQKLVECICPQPENAE